MFIARRAVATLLALALFWSSPGVEGHQAFGQALRGVGRISKAPVRLAPLSAPRGSFKPLALPGRMALPQAPQAAAPRPPQGSERPALDLAQEVVESAAADLARPDAGSEEAHAVGQRMADGSGWSRVKKAAAVSVLAAGLGLAIPSLGTAQTPVSAQVAVERTDATVGDRIRVVVTLKNNSDKPVLISELGQALKKALPPELELSAAADAPLTLAPGQSLPVAFDLTPFNAGELSVAKVETKNFVLPAFQVSVKSVLTPDWEEKGFKDIFDAASGQTPNFAWLGALGLGLSFLAGLKRLAAPKKYPGLAPGRPILEETRARIEALEKQGHSLSGPKFYAELYETLSGFLVDHHGLPIKARSSEELSSDLDKAGVLTPGQLSLARRLAARAQTGRFAGQSADSEARRQDLVALKELVASVAANKPGGGSQGNSLFGFLGLLPAAAALQFGTPWALLLMIPVGALLGWSMLSRKPQAHAVSSMTSVDKTKTWRTRLSWLPRFLRHAAIVLTLAALARPQLGVSRRESFTPSTDTITVTDLSGSMSEKFGSQAGAPTKLEAAKKAVEAYILEQRRGTTNRVGMVTFSDDPYLDVRLTTDYDALIAHLKELKTSDSTAIGKGMLTAIGHFIEINILELDASADARYAELQAKLQKGGLAQALEFIKAQPDLMQKALRPDRKKIMVVFSDGESNSGIPPVEAARIVKKLNDDYGFSARVYTVGIAPQDQPYGGGFDEDTMREIAGLTGGQFFRAGDAARMKEVLLEISRLEKSPTQMVSTLTVNEYQNLLALLAFLMLSLEIGLSSTALRRLPAIMLLAALPAAGVSPEPPNNPARKIEWRLPSAWTIPAEMAAGNKFYAQGRFEDAIKKYAEALAKHPDLSALHFNLGDAYLRLGDLERAEASYKKFLARAPEKAQASRAYHNLGNAALMREQPDVAQAVEMYKEALRRDPANAQAKWNLEMAQKARKEQQKNEGEGEGDKKDGQKQDQKQDPKKGEGKDKEQKEGEGDPKEGQPGEQQGKPEQGKEGQGKESKEKSGLEELQEKQGEQEGEAEQEALRGISRNGDKVWGAALLPMAFSFSSPWVLWGLVAALPVMAGLLAYSLVKKFKAAQGLAPEQAPTSLPVWEGWRNFLVKSALVLGAGSLLGLGAAGPLQGTKDERLNFGGKDILMTVDGSYSMVYAEDGRLARTKKELTDFISRMQGSDRVGLVVFAGTARTASPLSIDYGNFAFKLRSLEREARGLREGSDLVAAIKHSADSFNTVKKIGDRPKILVVISDGDIFDQEIEEAVKTAKDAGISIYTIGVGSLEGTQMLVPTEDGKGSVYLEDSQTGKPARSYLKEEPLKQIAARTGGAYFRAQQEASIEKILEKVAQIQKGSRGDTIKSPRGVASWFLWPSLLLLLLDLLFPGKALLPKKERTSDESGKMGLMGMALLPLGAWPQILPFAAAFTVIGVLVLADVVSGGNLSRRLRWALERRLGLVGKGLRKDGPSLFTAREADAAKLSDYLSLWLAAPEAGKEELIAQAAADRQLWREKLSAVYLGGNKPGVQENILGVLTQLSRERLDSLTIVLDRVRAQSPRLRWLDHPDVLERLERLSRIGRGPVLEPTAAPAAGRGWVRKISLSLAALFVAGGAALTGWSAVKTFEFKRQQAAAEQEALRIIFAEDAFIFGDKYADARIPELVLPALTGRPGAADLDRALEVLAKSSDPKADNILEALFKRANFLGLSAAAETKLLTALLERDNDHIWRFMEGHLAKTADEPKTVARLMKMIDLGASIGSERIFQNLFYFLKSPNPKLASHAAAVVRASLAAPNKAENFLDWLARVQEKFAQDPDLNGWLEFILWERLAAAPGSFNQLSKARALLDRVQGAVKNDERSLEFMRSSLSLARKTGTLPGGDRLTDTILYALNRNTKKMIMEAEGLFSGLHAEFLKAEVVLPDTEGYSRSRDDYDDYHGYGRGHGGYRESRPAYRTTYRLKHLRDLRRLILQAGASADATPAQKEFLARADASLEAMLSLAAQAAMPEGGTLGEAVASELNPVLYKGRWSFSTSFFFGALRREGLAPDNDTVGETESFRPEYDYKALVRIKKFMTDLETGGQSEDNQGQPRPMEKAERDYLAQALETIDALMEKHYPQEAATRTMIPLGGLLSRGSFDRALKSADALVLGRLAAASERHEANAEIQLWLLQRALDLAARPETDGSEAGTVLKKMVERADKAGRGDPAWSLVEQALSRGNAAAVKTLSPILEAQVNALVENFFYQTAYIFHDLRSRVRKAGGQIYAPFKTADLEIIRKTAAELAAEAGKDITPEQRKMADLAEVLFPRLVLIASKIPPTGEAKTSLNGLAPFGLVMAAGGLSGVFPVALLGLMFAALAAGFVYLWRLAPRSAFEAPDRDQRLRLAKIGLAAKRFADSPAAGLFRSLAIGAGGTDFAESAAYHNEDRKFIDWKTSAKKGELFVKKFEQEKEMPLILMVDLSRSSRPGAQESKRAVLEETAAVLALAAARLNVRVGAMIFTDKVEKIIAPKGGSRHAWEIADSLMAFEPQGRGTDFQPALEQALRQYRSRAMVVMVSDLLTPDLKFRDSLSAVARKHDFRLIRVFDPREKAPLPQAGLVRLEDAESGEVQEVDTESEGFRARQAAALQSRENELASVLEDARVRPIEISTQGDYLEALSEHFDPKRKQ